MYVTGNSAKSMSNFCIWRLLIYT